MNVNEATLKIRKIGSAIEEIRAVLPDERYEGLVEAMNLLGEYRDFILNSKVDMREEG